MLLDLNSYATNVELRIMDILVNVPIRVGMMTDEMKSGDVARLILGQMVNIVLPRQVDHLY